MASDAAEEPLDLSAIEKRLKEDYPELPWWAEEDVEALVAEVKRLRGEEDRKRLEDIADQEFSSGG